MRFHWVDGDAGSSYETTDTREVLATVVAVDGGFGVKHGIATASALLESRTYPDLATAKQDVEAVVLERFNNRPLS